MSIWGRIGRIGLGLTKDGESKDLERATVSAMNAWAKRNELASDLPFPYYPGDTENVLGANWTLRDWGWVGLTQGALLKRSVYLEHRPSKKESRWVNGKINPEG